MITEKTIIDKIILGIRNGRTRKDLVKPLLEYLRKNGVEIKSDAYHKEQI